MRRRLTALARHAHPARPLAAYRLLRESQRWSPEALRAFQEDRLRALLSAAARVPFWRERLAEAGLSPGRAVSLEELAALPPLERRELQREDFHRLRAPGRRGVVVSTSGSSGQPVRVLRPLELTRWVEAADLRAREWYGIGPGERRLSVPGRRPSRRARLAALASNTYILDPVDLAELSRAAPALERRPPALVAGTSDGLYLLALGLRELGRRLEPRAVWSGASVLLEHQRRVVEAVLGRRVSSRYGAWEAGAIAHECPEAGRLHVFAENVVLEVVRADGTPAPPGEAGEVLVTVLHNTAMPIVRYRLGDLAALAAGPCPCGRTLPALEGLVGRSNSLLVAADGTLVLPNRVASEVMAALRSVRDFRVVQGEDLRLHVEVVHQGAPDEAAADRAAIARALDGLVGMPGATTVEPVAELAPGPGGKLRHVLSQAAPRPPAPDGTARGGPAAG